MGRCEGIVHIFSRVRAPGDNIYPLPLKLLHNVLHPRTFHTDAGAYRIDI